MLRSDNRCTIQANSPMAAAHTVAIRSKTPQPAAVDMPPCTDRVSAIHGTHVTTNIRPCRNPQPKATRAREPNMLASNSVQAEPGENARVSSTIGEG